MSKREKAVIARLTIHGEHLEILVNPDLAWAYRSGKPVDLREVLVSDIIYKDIRQGLKASEEFLKKVFQTTDPYKIADIILKKGELQLTAEQRRQMIEEKRKQIIAFIARNCVDPKTGLPHPPTRIENALAQVKVSIDPFKGVEEQALDVIKALRSVLPLKIAQVSFLVKIPPQYAGKAYGPLSKMGDIVRSSWLSDGSWQAEIVIPAGMQQAFIDKVNALTKGEAQVEIIKKP